MSRPRIPEPNFKLAQRGSGGKWSVCYWDGHQSRRVSCGTTDRREAESFLAAFRIGSATKAFPRVVTIGAILDGYEADRAGKVHSSTLSQVCATLRRHLGPLEALLLTKDRISGYQADRRQEGAGGASAAYRKRQRQLSNGTLIRELGTLRSALTWATRQAPPWLPSAPYIEMPSAPPPRDRWLTHYEANRLLAACEAAHVRLFVALALHTAHRTGAILGLTWDRVDLIRRHIDLGDGRGKKRRARHLPINDILLPEIEAAQQAATTQWVVEYRGDRVASVKTGFRAACKRAHLRSVTPHVMRHTAVTWMVQAGVPFPMIAAYAAMSNDMVEKRYGHHSPDWMRQASDALAGGFPRQIGVETTAEVYTPNPLK